MFMYRYMITMYAVDQYLLIKTTHPWILLFESRIKNVCNNGRYCLPQIRARVWVVFLDSVCRLIRSCSRHVTGTAVLQRGRGGRSTPSLSTHTQRQTALDERTESFVPKTKPNLCQTNELKRPTWEVNVDDTRIVFCGFGGGSVFSNVTISHLLGCSKSSVGASCWWERRAQGDGSSPSSLGN